MLLGDNAIFDERLNTTHSEKRNMQTQQFDTKTPAYVVNDNSNGIKQIKRPRCNENMNIAYIDVYHKSNIIK